MTVYPDPSASRPVAQQPVVEPISVTPEILKEVASGTYFDPHQVLGPHLHEASQSLNSLVTVRVLAPLADAVVIITNDGTSTSRFAATHECNGIWYAVMPGKSVPDYRVETTYGELVREYDDPYRFLPSLTEFDLHLITEGRHEQLWDVLGSHIHRFPSIFGEVTGASFAVWAPNARAVRVVGDFNQWQGAAHTMRSLGSSGVWEIFIPGLMAGERYKFEVGKRDGSWQLAADPMARQTEVPPATASIITESSHTWSDNEWIKRRTELNPHTGPISVYEVHLGSWRQGLGYRELADQLVDYVKGLGFTHVEFMPVMEHPFGGSWGYQITSYYAPSARWGVPDDFKYLVDRLHQADIGVILDWVPAHFPKDEWALAQFDGTALYEHPDPLVGEHPDWGTLVFNYGRNEVRNFLVANAVYWLSEYHIDGIRVDAVASMLYLDYSRGEGQWRPNEYGGRENLDAISFLQEMNATAYKRVPGIMTIAEESTAFPGVTAPTSAGGLGFGLKWNMGWMNDSLSYIKEEPINRQYHHGDITFSLVYAFSENYVLPISHDEVVHGKGSLLRKMPGDRWQQLANVRAYLAFMWAHPGKQLIFMGTEFAQDNEWAEGRSLDWGFLDDPGHAGVTDLVRDLNFTYQALGQIWDQDFSAEGFEWITADDAANNTLAFIRRDRDGRPFVAVVNFAGVPHENYRLGLPEGGIWREVLNTDSTLYGGSGVGNLGEVRAEQLLWHGRDHSVRLRVPPLGALWLVPAADIS